MAATAASRSARSTAPGVSNGTSARATRLLARVMRCSMALSPTRKARAICLTDRPETMRSASAICWVAGRSGWQQMNKQAQDVVAIVRAVEPLDELGFGVVQIGDDLLGRQRLLLAPAPHLVDRDVAPDHDEPGGGIARRTVLRPVPAAPAGTRPGRPPRRCRGRGNSAAARRAPAGARRSAPHRSRPSRSRHAAPRQEQADRPDLIGAARDWRGQARARSRAPPPAPRSR